MVTTIIVITIVVTTSIVTTYYYSIDPKPEAKPCWDSLLDSAPCGVRPGGPDLVELREHATRTKWQEFVQNYPSRSYS